MCSIDKKAGGKVGIRQTQPAGCQEMRIVFWIHFVLLLRVHCEPTCENSTLGDRLRIVFSISTRGQ